VCKIRKAEEKDLSEIMEIYNKEIREGTATFDTVEKTTNDMKKWFRDHGSKNPIVVAEDNSNIVGWAALSKYSNRCAYSITAELSLYIKEDCQGQGIGSKLMESILNEGEKAGLHTAIARISEGNENSIYVHKKFGFEHVGIYKEVGEKFGRLIDVYLMQKIFED
jgi:phosphinothricin acetyltransferase